MRSGSRALTRIFAIDAWGTIDWTGDHRFLQSGSANAKVRTAHQSRHGPEEWRRLLWRRFRLRLTRTNSYNSVTL